MSRSRPLARYSLTQATLAGYHGPLMITPVTGDDELRDKGVSGRPGGRHRGFRVLADDAGCLGQVVVGRILRSGSP